MHSAYRAGQHELRDLAGPEKGEPDLKRIYPAKATEDKQARTALAELE